MYRNSNIYNSIRNRNLAAAAAAANHQAVGNPGFGLPAVIANADHQAVANPALAIPVVIANADHQAVGNPGFGHLAVVANANHQAVEPPALQLPAVVAEPNEQPQYYNPPSGFVPSNWQPPQPHQYQVEIQLLGPPSPPRQMWDRERLEAAETLVNFSLSPHYYRVSAGDHAGVHADVHADVHDDVQADAHADVHADVHTDNHVDDHVNEGLERMETDDAEHIGQPATNSPAPMDLEVVNIVAAAENIPANEDDNAPGEVLGNVAIAAAAARNIPANEGDNAPGEAVALAPETVRPAPQKMTLAEVLVEANLRQRQLRSGGYFAADPLLSKLFNHWIEQQQKPEFSAIRTDSLNEVVVQIATRFWGLSKKCTIPVRSAEAGKNWPAKKRRQAWTEDRLVEDQPGVYLFSSCANCRMTFFSREEAMRHWQTPGEHAVENYDSAEHNPQVEELPQE